MGTRLDLSTPISFCNSLNFSLPPSDDGEVGRGRELVLRGCAGAGGRATVRRSQAMLCPDAALPTDTTGRKGVCNVADDICFWKRPRVG